MEKEILSIPIYRCDSKQHSKEMKNAKKKYWESCFKYGDKDFIEKMSIEFDKGKWFPWQYNEVVGWLQINLNNSKLIAELWFVENRISKQLRNKRILCQGKAFECFLHGVNENSRIVEIIYSSLIDWIKTSNRIKKRYIDVEDVRFKMSLIDWIKAIKLLTSGHIGRAKTARL